MSSETPSKTPYTILVSGPCAQGKSFIANCVMDRYIPNAEPFAVKRCNTHAKSINGIAVFQTDNVMIAESSLSMIETTTMLLQSKALTDQYEQLTRTKRNIVGFAAYFDEIRESAIDVVVFVFNWMEMLDTTRDTLKEFALGGPTAPQRILLVCNEQSWSATNASNLLNAASEVLAETAWSDIPCHVCFIPRCRTDGTTSASEFNACKQIMHHLVLP